MVTCSGAWLTRNPETLHHRHRVAVISRIRRDVVHRSRLIRIPAIPEREKNSLPFPAARQYTIFRIQGDGNCLFRALIQSYHSIVFQKSSKRIFEPLSSEEETVKSEKLRQDICNTMLAQKDFIEPFLPGSDVESYVETMRQRSTWGGEPELSMASLVLQIPVVVYQPQEGSTLGKIAEYNLYDASCDDEIALLYSGGVHYDALIDLGRL